jgi:hypothetical protein
LLNNFICYFIKIFNIIILDKIIFFKLKNNFLENYINFDDKSNLHVNLLKLNDNVDININNENKYNKNDINKFLNLNFKDKSNIIKLKDVIQKLLTGLQNNNIKYLNKITDEII